MTLRLEKIEKGLVQKLRLVNEEQRANAVKVACLLAFQACPVEESIVVECLRRLRSGHKITNNQVSELNALAAQLDDKYFESQDSLDEGQKLNVEGLQLFGQARAVSALSLAGGEDSLTAATEAIYEAFSAVDDATHIFKAVLSVLQES
ncbi:hypothetical protein [Pseudomonas orientalis]|uniref:hypothetical protein n=1 Tax=Pseudomonas orientalis TaxID=76758 RepID=UPI00070CD788|nr:hypothetical protein [Pseudomonas orientalis]KRP62620.1 hypothetical protein TU82_22005 [Pseudomonas orientalis]